MNQEKVVIYHGNCYDGVTAAWVCFKALDSANVEYLPFNYSDAPPDVKGKDVYIVDFSFKYPIMEKIIQEAEYVTILDHHKTAEAELKNLSAHNITIVFDKDRSGAGITWDYFFPKDQRPNLVNYVEDRDLWRFNLPDAKKVTAWIQSWDIDLDTWIKDVGPLSESLKVIGMAQEGQSLLRLQDKLVKSICYNAEIKEIGGFIGPYIQTSVLMSEVCHELLQQYPDSLFSWYSFKRKDGKYQYGLRGKGDFDVSIIAKQYGGGGHKSAAGFESDVEL